MQSLLLVQGWSGSQAPLTQYVPAWQGFIGPQPEVVIPPSSGKNTERSGSPTPASLDQVTSLPPPLQPPAWATPINDRNRPYERHSLCIYASPSRAAVASGS